MRSRLLGAVGAQPELCQKLTISRALLGAVVLGFSSGSGAVCSETTIIDFDQEPCDLNDSSCVNGLKALDPGDVLTGQYSEWGVTFSADEDSATTVNPAYPDFGNQWVNCYNYPCDTQLAETLIITFDRPVENVHWLTHPAGNNPDIEFTAYYSDLGGPQTETVTVGPGYQFQEKFFLASNITRIEASRESDPDFNGWSIDNLSFEAPPSPTRVTIDVKPGSDPNKLNLNEHGVIPVAILGSEHFDVANIDKGTLKFIGMEVRVRGKKGPPCSFEFVNDDSYLDLVCHFEDNDPNEWVNTCGEGTLTGALLNASCDDTFEGSDWICVGP